MGCLRSSSSSSCSGVEFFAHAGQSCGDGDIFKIAAGVEGGLGGEVGEGDVGGEEFVFQMDFKDGFAVFYNGEVDE